MDGKYKQFSKEAAFQAQPDAVREAIRAFAGNWLASWNLAETPDSIEATGQVGGHLARATFRIGPAAAGSNLTIALQVEHAESPDAARGDTVEDYDGLVRNWLEAIPWWIAQKQVAAAFPAGGEGKPFPTEPRKRRPIRTGDIVGTAFLMIWILVITFYAFAALIGLVTGELTLPSKRTGNLGTTRGLAARVISTFILAIYGWIVYSFWKWRKKHKGEPWI